MQSRPVLTLDDSDPDDSDLIDIEEDLPSGVRVAAERVAFEVALPLVRPRQSTWAAAKTAAARLCNTLRAKAVVILACDEARDELRIIAAAGAGADDLLGETVADDFVSSAAIVNERTVVVASVIAVPIIAGARCVGVIKAIEARGSEGHLVGTIEHQARLVASRF